MLSNYQRGFGYSFLGNYIFSTYLCADGYFPNTQPNHSSNNYLLWHRRGRNQALQDPSAQSRPCIKNSDNLFGGEC